MKYFSVKCSYDVHELFYKRKFPKHNHEAEGQFVIDAKNRAVAALAIAGVVVTSDNIDTTQIAHSDKKLGDRCEEI